METDDLKSAWQQLDQRLAADRALHLDLLRERRLDRTRSRLRPLFWGQVVQIGFGLLCIGLAALLWSTRPTIVSAIVAGAVVQAYGVVTIIVAGLVLGGLGEIDYDAPVLEIQTRLATVRRRYVLGGLLAGLPWWFLWVPVLMTLAGAAGVDLVARAPALVWGGVGVGVLGLLATIGFYRWARDPARRRLARWMDTAVTGASLRKAQAQLDELRRFAEGG